VLLKILNYSIRALVLVIGLIFLTGLIIPAGGDSTMFRVMGLVVTLFGLYRLTTYYLQQKRYKFDNDDDTQ